MQITEQKIDVQAALMRLVDDQGVVFEQITIVPNLSQQHAVGHQLDMGLITDVIAKTDLVADAAADFLSQLGGDTQGKAARRNPSGLGVPDAPVDPTPDIQADLRQLGRFARPGLSAQHDHLVGPDQPTDLVEAFGDR